MYDTVIYALRRCDNTLKDDLFKYERKRTKYYRYQWIRSVKGWHESSILPYIYSGHTYEEVQECLPVYYHTVLTEDEAKIWIIQ
jgi:hypothetical protein